MHRVLVVLLTLVLAGCIQGGPGASGQGVHGTAMAGPTCPVEQSPPNASCADRPFVGNLSVTTGDGSRIVSTFATDANGTFNVTLAPGTYAVSNAPGSPNLPRCASQGTFTVTAGSWVLANISCDTGIR